MQGIESLGNRFHDLTYFGVTNVVLAVNDVTTLLTSGESTSDDLENYLMQINNKVIPSQPMARMKQTARKTTADGTLPVTTTGDTTGTPARHCNRLGARIWRYSPDDQQGFWKTIPS